MSDHGSTAMSRRRRRRLASAFDREERAGYRLALRARSAALLIVAVWLFYDNGANLTALYYLGLVGAFMALGLARYGWRQTRFWAPWHAWLFVLADLVLVTAAIVFPNPFAPQFVHPAMFWRWGNSLWYFVILVEVMLIHSPALVLWAGFVAASLWLASFYAIAAWAGGETSPGPGDMFALMARENYLNMEFAWRDAIVLMIVAGMAAAVSARARRLVLTQAIAERARGNLARYFSPTIADRLAESDRPFDRPREQPVAVLFVDIVGFTKLCESLSAERVVALLRDYHARLASLVFAFGGTIDKYMGDGLMATFGTLESTGEDARHALDCVTAMIGSIEGWNQERRRLNEPQVDVRFGLHYGPVVLGDIGDERHVEFSAIGSTVNIASRLEELTRKLGVNAAVSEALLRAAAAPSAGMIDFGLQKLRGLEEPVRVYGLAAPLARAV